MFARADITSLGTNRTASFTAVGAATVVFLLATACALYFWLAQNPARELAASLPGADGRPAGLDAEKGPLDLSGTFASFDGTPADLPGDWPRFRGPDSSNIHTGTEPLAAAWEAGGPRVLWSVELGEGFAGDRKSVV